MHVPMRIEGARTICKHISKFIDSEGSYESGAGRCLLEDLGLEKEELHNFQVDVRPSACDMTLRCARNIQLAKWL